MFAESTRVFLNLFAELNDALQIPLGEFQFFSVDYIWILYDRIGNKASDLFAEFD